MESKYSILLLYTVITFTHNGEAQFSPGSILQGCDKRSCYPATGNLLIGREDKLEASDTCGLQNQEKYCVISALDSHTYGRVSSKSVNEKCYHCDASDRILAHNVSSIVYRYEPAGRPRHEQHMTWWQASNGKPNISIQLDLEAEFHVTHIIITFKTFRPAAMFIEKSFDWGKTWKIHRYFAYDCEKDFPGVHMGVPRYLNETVCQSRYSRLAPSTKGEVIYRVLPPNIKFNSPGFNPYSKEVQDLLKTTNLRVTFTKLHTLGDENLAENTDLSIKEKYYFSIYDMIVRGSCSCYGHAARCVPEKKEHEDIRGMVHGTCECDHNTMGNNCELCQDFYQDLPWRPATGKKKNACKICNCNNHSDRCYFDERVFAASGNTSGGVCLECLHSTEGKNCEMCQLGFFQDPSRQTTDPDICAECDCEPDGTIDDGICDERTSEGYAGEPGTVAGQCHCKTYVGGPRCDHCTPGYWNFTTENPDGCQQCTCNPQGTVQSVDGGCNEQTGECQCKRNVARVRDCDQCLPEHYGLSESDPLGCKPCDCDTGGAYNNQCDVNSGQCQCRPNLKGRRCDQVEDFHYTGPLDYLVFEAELAHGSDKPPTRVIRKKPSEVPGQTTWTGFGYMQVFEGSTLTFDVPQVHRTMDYFPVVRYQQEASNPNMWEAATIELVRMDGPPDPAGSCSESYDIQAFSLPAGQTYAEVSSPFCLEETQRYQIKITFDQYDPNIPQQGAKILIDSIALLPDIDDIPFLNPYYEQQLERTDSFVPIIGETRHPEGSGWGHPEGSGEDTIEGSSNDTSFTFIDPGFLGILGESTSTTTMSPPSTPGRRKPRPSLMEGWFPGQEKVEFDREQFNGYQCRQFFLEALPGRLQQVPRECDELLYSISFLTFQGAFMRPCDCDTTGSTTGMCDKYYGGCDCKTLVVGRECDTCAPAAFGFSSSGCQRCECHHLGSQDEFCNQDTGQCRCNTLQPTFGRRCDECKPGYWNFPDCRQCECNGHADTCHPQTGECNSCRDSTQGSFCEECKLGYYGIPEAGEDQVPCRECRCPDTQASGHSYAETCYLDIDTMQPVCHCEDGYDGDRCDICYDNFYGNPEMPGGECRSCDCSNNWASEDEGNCDPHTGECLKCLFDTEGYNCERCKAGYYGDAVQSQCLRCNCDPLGTDSSFAVSVDPPHFECHRETGQCHCLPNVEGFLCGECKENHWKIASGTGCEDCDCDPVGSNGDKCNLFTGQCDCREGFGGRQCNQCQDNYWGNPGVKCIPCNCNPMGVNPEQTQCDHQTGRCFCLEGIGGDKCDECDVGHVQDHPIGPEHEVQTRVIPFGDRPNCTPCGECFDNWNRILEELQANTTSRVEEARKVKLTGAAGAYATIFQNMEDQIEEVNEIIDQSSLKNEELAGFSEDIQRIEEQLADTNRRTKELDYSLADTEQKILGGQYNLTELRKKADRLMSEANNIKDKATELQEANVGGALTLTQQAKLKSDQAKRQVDMIAEEMDGRMLYDSANTRSSTKRLMNDRQAGITNSTATNTQDLNEVTGEIERLEERIPGLNKAVCDGETTVDRPCDDLCGGAGCGKCGDVSCGDGALTKSMDALADAKEAEKLLKEKDLKAEEALNRIYAVKQKVEESTELAQVAFDMSSEAKNRSKTESDEVDTLTKRIEEFLQGENATPEQVKAVAEKCLAAEMTMDAKQIQDLAEQINTATASVTDVDKINQETAGPLATAESLKERADRARDEAAAQLTLAEKVTKSLGDAEEAQNVAEEAITSALSAISEARKDLGFIKSEMDEGTAVSNKSFEDTLSLMERQKLLQTAYISNENHVKKAQTAADGAKSQASKANSDLYKLNSNFKTVSESLTMKEQKIGSAKDRALSLQRRASSLSNSASQKLANLLDMEKQYEDNQKELEELAETLRQMNCQMQIHLKVIQHKSNFYTTCQPPSTWSPAEDCTCSIGQTEPNCQQLPSSARY